MPTSYLPPETPPECYPKGFRGAGMFCGIKNSGKRDLSLIVSDVPSLGAGMFTLNRFAAAPVEVSREIVANGQVRGIICNSGVANACTGPQGMADARTMVRLTGEALGVDAGEIAVCSTGVIGECLPMDVVEKGVRAIATQLAPDAWTDVVDAMRTTDAFPKMVGANWQQDESDIRLLGLGKGGGMIHPNMATMLAFMLTDCAIELDALRAALKDAVAASFNSITVDGDTSTNDTVLVLANGQAGNKPITLDSPAYETFRRQLTDSCVALGKSIVRDGEGATKIGIITVKGATNNEDARRAAVAVGRSPLVKTALYGSDPNWGRIVCAVGYSGAEVDVERCSVSLGDQLMLENGLPLEVDKARAAAHLEQPEALIEIDLGLGGPGTATVYTSDLTHDYIQLNAFYHT